MKDAEQSEQLVEEAQAEHSGLQAKQVWLAG